MTIDLKAILTPLLALLALIGGCPGCAQSTPQTTMQPTQAAQDTRTDQGALGSTTHVNFAITQNASGRQREPQQLGDAIGSPEGAFAVSDFQASDQASLASASGTGDVMIVVFDTQSGGSSTGAQTGGGTSGLTSTPGVVSTITAEQKPEASVQVPITAAWAGGTASGQASGATGQGQAHLSAEVAQSTRVALTELSKTNPEAASLLGQLLGVVFEPAATQPAEGGN
jgi:hypothetical protein